jgi:glycosyltransferase involved in cell wall biosynthesis
VPDRGTSILYVITDLEVGGVPLHLVKLVAATRARGYRAAVASLAPPGPVGEMLREDGVEVLSCEGRGGWDLRILRRLKRILADRQPDLVHALLFHANVAARWAAPRAGFSPGRVVCEIQTVEVERRWHLWVDRFTHGGCRFTIGNSPSVVDHLAERARIPRSRLRLVKGGVDVARIRNAPRIARSDLDLTDEHRVILWTGRLDPVKGLVHLIDAMAAVAVENSNAVLLLVGEGAQRAELETRIRARDLSDHVRLLGRRSDVPSLLHLADVYTLPSRTEGLPNALLEAMAAGCPIVATNVPGCRDLIQPDRTGLIVPFGSTDALAAALKKLLSDPDLARTLGGAAAHSAATDWSIDQTWASYHAAYEEALRGN